MGSEQAREVLAEHADRNGYPLCAESVRKGDDPYFNRVMIDAMLSFAATAREQALREAAEALMNLRKRAFANAACEWSDGVASGIDDAVICVKYLLTKEPKA